MNELPADVQARIRSQLAPGETVVWAAQPIGNALAKKSFLLWIFFIPWTAFALFWMAGAAQFKVPDFSKAWDFFPLFGVPFVLVGLGGLSLPFWIWRGAKRSAYVITNQRAFAIGDTVRGVHVRSYPPDKLRSISRTEQPDGSGDLILEATQYRDSDGDLRTAHNGFFSVPEVRKVELLLNGLASKGQPASASVPPPSVPSQVISAGPPLRVGRSLFLIPVLFIVGYMFQENVGGMRTAVLEWLASRGSDAAVNNSASPAQRSERARQAVRSEASVVTPPEPPVPGRNLIDDPSFERGDPRTATPGWTAYTEGSDAKAEWSAQMASSGTHSLAMTATHGSKGWPGWISRGRFPISPGRSYLFSVQATTADHAVAWLAATYFDARGQSLGGTSTGCRAGVLAPGQWRRLEHEVSNSYFKSATEVELALRTGCNVPDDGKAATIFYDDVFFGVPN